MDASSWDHTMVPVEKRPARVLSTVTTRGDPHDVLTKYTPRIVCLMRSDMVKAPHLALCEERLAHGVHTHPPTEVDDIPSRET